MQTCILQPPNNEQPISALSAADINKLSRGKTWVTKTEESKNQTNVNTEWLKGYLYHKFKFYLL